MMSKYFITGGAGFVGINLTRFLLEIGHSVVSYDFAEEYNFPNASDPRISVHKGAESDIRNYEILKRAMVGCDIVIHCAAAMPAYSRKENFDINVVGTRCVLEAAKANGIHRVIFTSSFSVYGHIEHSPALETDELNGKGAYEESKIEAEAVCTAFRKAGMVIPVLRSATILGPWRLGSFALFFEWAKDGCGFPIIGNGKNRFQMLDVSDYCRFIYLCATLPDGTVNTVFNVGADHCGTMREEWQAVLDKAGFGKKIVGLPKTPTIWALALLHFLRLSPLHSWIYESASRDNLISTKKAERLLGWEPVYSNGEVILRSFIWYLANLDEINSAVGVTNHSPWKQGILKLAKKFF
jgi:nucleoside-diphosphate-sugar epimerase